MIILRSKKKVIISFLPAKGPLVPRSITTNLQIYRPLQYVHCTCPLQHTLPEFSPLPEAVSRLNSGTETVTTAAANPYGKEYLLVSERIKEAEKHIYVIVKKLVWFLCIFFHRNEGSTSDVRCEPGISSIYSTRDS
jgi:hypothetical protein